MTARTSLITPRQLVATMLRITTRSEDGELVLKLEGCVEGAWVRELEACWREAAVMSHDWRLRVDLADVCHVDDRGRELLAAMFRAGVRFSARGFVMPELVREISERVRN